MNSMEYLFKWEPITPSNVILFIAVLVALLGPRIWKCVDDHRNRTVLIKTIIQLLKNLRSDVVRIRDERNQHSGSAPVGKIQFSTTSIAEISHYFYIFKDLVLPNLAALKFPKESKTIDLFDHYLKNIEDATSKKHLSYATVTKLISRIDAAIDELSKGK